MNKLTIPQAEKFQQLLSGSQLPKSLLKGNLVDELISENLIVVNGRGKQTLTLRNSEAFSDYLFREYGISDLSQYISQLQKSDNVLRSDLVKVSSNSKTQKIRTFTGFLVNSFMPIPAKVSGKDFIISPVEGTFLFISDYESFIIDKDIVVIGVENAENFRYINRQKDLFSFTKCLFVCRYPQNQNKDFINWLLKISNPYYHFGDYDFAGLNIFVNEYQKHLGNRAKLFVPNNLEKYFELYGNRELFYNQDIKFEINNQDNAIKTVYNLINKYQKGLEQEVFIV